MACENPTPLPDDLATKVTDVPILVVGAGGIGCELLKNLVLTGFKNITIVSFSSFNASMSHEQLRFGTSVLYSLKGEYTLMHFLEYTLCTFWL
jgi:molybdopterin/thiamine biosynthesis adenylyltransferase